MIRVKDEPDLARDSKGVIQNTNTTSYQAFIARRAAAEDNKARISALEKDNADIKQSLSLIIKLLTDNQNEKNTVQSGIEAQNFSNTRASIYQD